MNTPQKIADQIKTLLDELVGMTEGKAVPKARAKRVVSTSVPKGASGALKILTNDGFFDTPQDISKINMRLRLKAITEIRFLECAYRAPPYTISQIF